MSHRIDKKAILACLKSLMPNIPWIVVRDENILTIKGFLGTEAGSVYVSTTNEPFFYAYPAGVEILGVNNRHDMSAIPLTPQQIADWVYAKMNDALVKQRAVTGQIEYALDKNRPA